MTMIGRWLLLGALAAPLLSLGAMTWLRARPSTGARVSAALQWVGAVMAALLTTVVAIHGTVAVTAGVGAWSLGTRHHPGRGLLSVSLIVAASALYGFVAAGFFAWVSPDLPAVGSAVLTPWLLLAIAAGGVTTALLLHAPAVGPRLRIALIGFGAPAGLATQRITTLRPLVLHQPRPSVGAVPVRSAA